MAIRMYLKNSDHPWAHNRRVIEPSLEHRICKNGSQMLAGSTRVFLLDEHAFILRSVGDAACYKQHLNGGTGHTNLASFNAFRRSTQFGQAPHGNCAEAWHE